MMEKELKDFKGHREEIFLSDLKQHPSAAKIYSYRNIQGLADDISGFGGMINQIKVNKDKVVLGGWRRKLACELLGIEKLFVWVVDDITPEDEELYIVLDNAMREKTHREKYHEAAVYRQSREKNQGKRTDLIGGDPINMRKEIAEKMDIKPGELYNLLIVGDENEALLDSIDGANVTLSSLALKIRSAEKNDSKYDAVVPISLEPVGCPTCNTHDTPRIVSEGKQLFYEN